MAQHDAFAGNQGSVTAPGGRHFLIVPSDTEDMPERPRAIYCHTAGTLVVVDEAGTALPYSMAAGQQIVFRGVRVRATGTTGTYYGWV